MSVITDAYQSALGREPDAEGLAYWEGEVERGAMTEAQAAEAIANSPEGQAYAANQKGNEDD